MGPCLTPGGFRDVEGGPVAIDCVERISFRDQRVVVLTSIVADGSGDSPADSFEAHRGAGVIGTLLVGLKVGEVVSEVENIGVGR